MRFFKMSGGIASIIRNLKRINVIKQNKCYQNFQFPERKKC